jgi:hypothetical protein
MPVTQPRIIITDAIGWPGAARRWVKNYGHGTVMMIEITTVTDTVTARFAPSGAAARPGETAAT